MEKHIKSFHAALNEGASLRALTALAREIGQAVLARDAPLPAFTEAGIDQARDGTILGQEKVLYDTPNLVASLLETRPGNSQPPHDHWVDVIIVGLSGTERHHMSVHDGDTCSRAGEHLLRPGETMHLGPQAIHGIDAAGDEPAVALHLYLGALDSTERTMFHPDTGRAMPFDLNVYYGLCRRA